MGEEARKPPVVSAEDRARALEEAARTRKARRALKEAVAAGEKGFAEALDEPIARKMRVRQLVMAVPGIGERKCALVMAKAGIPESRRVGGMGCRQRERLLALVEEAGA